MIFYFHRIMRPLPRSIDVTQENLPKKKSLYRRYRSNGNEK